MWRPSAWPAVSPRPGTTWRTPSGTPASVASSARRNAVSGDCSAGFRTTLFPVASAGPTFQLAISSGKFHGTTAPTTPSGSRTSMTTSSGAVDVLHIACRNRRDHASGAGADAVERLPRGRVDVHAVDEGLRANRDAGEHVVDGRGHGAPPARSGSMMTTVRPPSPLRMRSSAASTPSRSVVCVITPARSSSPASASAASSGRSRAASPEP